MSNLRLSRKSFISPTDPATAAVAELGSTIREVISSIKEYAIHEETEKTERKRIEAVLTVALEKLRLDYKKFGMVTKYVFAERQVLFSALTEGLRIAISLENKELSQMLMDHIVKIYREDPMVLIDKATSSRPDALNILRSPHGHHE